MSDPDDRPSPPPPSGQPPAYPSAWPPPPAPRRGRALLWLGIVAAVVLVAAATAAIIVVGHDSSTASDKGISIIGPTHSRSSTTSTIPHHPRRSGPPGAVRAHEDGWSMQASSAWHRFKPAKATFVNVERAWGTGAGKPGWSNVVEVEAAHNVGMNMPAYVQVQKSGLYGLKNLHIIDATSPLEDDPYRARIEFTATLPDGTHIHEIRYIVEKSADFYTATYYSLPSTFDIEDVPVETYLATLTAR